MTPLNIAGFDHVVRAVPDLAPATAALQQLGISATPPGLSTGFSVGGPGNGVAIEFVTLAPDALDDPANADLAGLIRAGGGMHVLGFAVDDLAPARAMFAEGGFEECEIAAPVGDVPIRALRPLKTALGCNIRLLQYPPAVSEMRARHGAHAHGLPLKRVDHVAIVVSDLDTAQRAWTEVMGAEVTHAGQAFGMDMCMVKVGDVVIELLKPGVEGPLSDAAPGLRPTVSYQVDDLEAVMADVRARGFKVAEPTRSSVDNRVFTSIAPRQTAGLVFQFLQYL